jgi:hypothetical protein
VRLFVRLTARAAQKESIALRGDGRQPKWRGMVVRLPRLLLAVILALAFAGLPAIEAAAVVPCDATHASTIDGQASPGHAPASAPCKAMMPTCASTANCVSSAVLQGHSVSTAAPSIGERVAHWARTDMRTGWSIEPALNPPIAI